MQSCREQHESRELHVQHGPYSPDFSGSKTCKQVGATPGKRGQQAEYNAHGEKTMRTFSSATADRVRPLLFGGLSRRRLSRVDYATNRQGDTLPSACARAIL